MIENATNLTSTTNLANSIDIKLAVAIISSVLVGVGLFFKLKGWYTAKEANEIAKEANRISEETNETSKNIQKKQREQDRQVAKEQIIIHLERFISVEENGILKIDNRHQEKIAEIGNDFKKTLENIDINKILFPKWHLREMTSVRDKIQNLSEIRLVPSRTRGLNSEFEDIQIQNREKKGKELIEKARELIEKI